MYDNKMNYQEAEQGSNFARSRNLLTGNYGNDFKSSNIPSCSTKAYEQGMAQVDQQNRSLAAQQLNMQKQKMMSNSGMRR